MRCAPRLVAVITAVATTASATAIAVAQPVDPYGDAPPPSGAPAAPAKAPSTGAGAPRPSETPPSGVTDDRDPDVDEAVAAALVQRARELIEQDAWADAQQLLGEAVVRSPEGRAGSEARMLLEQVNQHLGVGQAAPVAPEPAVVPDAPVPVAQEIDRELPAPRNPARAGRAFIAHSIVIGGVVGGFFGDAVTADTEPVEVDGDPVGEEDSAGIVGGVLLGAVGGLAFGMAMRNNDWMNRDDLTVIDSFTAYGLVGSLSLGALMDPAEGEAYSVNAVIGTAGGLITGLVVAKNNDISSRRMARVDLWAAAGALTPWLIFAAADGDSDDAQVAGGFSILGMVGGAWLGFRVTRGWDAAPAARDDAPPAVVRRGSDGNWSVGAPALRPAQDPSLGPSLGRGASISLFGARW